MANGKVRGSPFDLIPRWPSWKFSWSPLSHIILISKLLINDSFHSPNIIAKDTSAMLTMLGNDSVWGHKLSRRVFYENSNRTYVKSVTGSW